jgi:diguanylate cyclase (GGDEF)-like protein
MKRWIPALAVICGVASAAWAAPPAPLTTLRAIHALTNAEASQGLPVAFEATLTYFRDYERTMFVQDGDASIYVNATTNTKLVPGDRILIKGTTHESFHPFVTSTSIALLYHGSLPTPAPVSYSEMIRAQRDCTLVVVRGVVHTADVVLSSNRRSTGLELQIEGGTIDAVVDSVDPAALRDLLDAEVEVTGVASGHFDGKMQQTGILLHVPSLAYVKVLKRAAANVWSIPVTPMDAILTGFQTMNLTRRIRVHGTITYYQPGSAVILQNGAQSLRIVTKTHIPLHIGALADATGYPDVNDGFLTLTGGEVQEDGTMAPVKPIAANWRLLASSKHLFDLVSIEGEVVMEVREAYQDEYVLVSGGNLFSAIYRHPPQITLIPVPVAPMRHVPIGARISVTGICVLETADHFDMDVPFYVLLRSPDDIAVVARPSLLNIDNLMIMVGLLLVAVFAAIARGWVLERKTRRQTHALALRNEVEADLERRRSRILEDINGSRPLTEVLEEIASLVSFKLGGAACWCHIDDGAGIGVSAADRPGLRIVRAEIQARRGPPLGVMLAGLDPLPPPCADETEALSIGAGLAALAIETRRLYSDLTHRSEFDLLTDLHNRFSLDRHLSLLIEEAGRTGGVFGLIYIDLDDFKQVNDLHGHHAGDLYLQEVALRMKRQLRLGDMLARLGGDEFAALTPMVRSRADVIEVAVRLERCLDEPFSVDGVILHGSASVGYAIYPEDGVTRDSLLSAADAAMYVAKHTRREIGGPIAVRHGADPLSGNRR